MNERKFCTAKICYINKNDNNIIYGKILLTIAILTTGIIYLTNVFFAVVGKKASRMSRSSSVADLLGHIHLVADERIQIIGGSRNL